MDKYPEIDSELGVKLREICPALVLASGSPNRRYVLENAGINVTVRPQDINEICGFSEPRLVVTTLSRQKMESYTASGLFDRNMPALAIDTLVSLDGKLIGKPKDNEDAASMLRSFSGRWHDVYSGMSVYRPADGKIIIVHERTQVKFRELSESDIDWYIGTGECRGAAGAYKIQKNGYRLIDEINGSLTNIIGMPLEKLIQVLSGAAESEY